ncbi:MAG: hypothetical protein L6R41_006327 [Letrouitia leprolyta]|nr:MAG: hypothetical protein L6R41_006327 [Letrouitia leprolyta]
MATDASRITAAPGGGIELDDLGNNGTSNDGVGIHVMAEDTTGEPTAFGNLTGSDQTITRPRGSRKITCKALCIIYSIAKGRMQTWWSRNITLTITHSQLSPHTRNNDPRDYLALERTFLSHVRTASVLAGHGIILVQLLILRNIHPTVGRILASICAGGGIVTILVGGYRYFHQQKRLTRGIVVVGGAGAWVSWGIFASILVTIFVVVLVVD